MKKMIKSSTTKLLLLFTMLLTQFSAFAADGGQSDESRWQIVSRMPQFWVGIALFVLLLTAGLLVGKRNKEINAV